MTAITLLIPRRHGGDGGYYKGNMTDGIITGQGDYQSAFNEVKLTITVFSQYIIGTVYDYLYVYVLYVCSVSLWNEPGFVGKLQRRFTSRAKRLLAECSGRYLHWYAYTTYSMCVCMYVWIIYIEFRFEILV